MLDNAKFVASESCVTFEIYKVEAQNAGSIFLQRFDYTNDWDWKFCPESSMPWGYCDELRNGDIMFYPTLTAAQTTKLYQDAIKIRTEFNFQRISRAQFDQAWTQAYKTRLEATRNDWIYEVGFLVDTPPWIDQAWREYVKAQDRLGQVMEVSKKHLLATWCLSRSLDINKSSVSC